MVGFLHPCVARLGVCKIRFATLAFGLILGIGATMVVTPAAAQGFGWLGRIFGGGQPSPAPQARVPSSDRHADGFRARPRHRVAEPTRTPRERDRPPSKNASAFVYVLGDAFGQNLALGLEEALADRQEVAIIHKARGSTGLAATDVFNWPRAVEDMLVASKTPKPGDPPRAEAKDDAGKGQTGKSTAGKSNAAKLATDKAASASADPAKVDPAASNPIDVAVMMIGSNDWQAIRLDGEILQPGTPDWTAEYRKRVMAIDEAFRRKGVPLIWVGLPIAKDDNLADEMAAFNDIYREAAAKTGTVYVDTWEAFSDDNGEFRPVGPDINGQITRLRMADGIYFTKAGSRKLAHFVESHVRRALDGKMARPPMPETSAPSAALVPKPEVGPISNLTEPPLSRGGQLAAAFRADAQIETAIVKGNPQSAPAGRADDLKWPASDVANP